MNREEGKGRKIKGRIKRMRYRRRKVACGGRKKEKKGIKKI